MSRPIRILWMISACVVAGLGPGCGGASQESRGGPRLVDAQGLFPLEAGNAWSYDVRNGIESVLAVSSVESADGARREVRTGNAIQIYEVRPEGIFRLASETWLLRNPVEEGAEWPSSGGRTAKITATGRELETPVGTFRDCVVVTEEGGEAHRIETTYCPDVGPVHVRTELQMELSGERVWVVGTLRGYNVATTREHAP